MGVVGVGSRPGRQRHRRGASANVVILGLAERNGRPVVFWQFTRYGPIATVITIAVCVPYPWQRYFPLA